MSRLTVVRFSIVSIRLKVLFITILGIRGARGALLPRQCFAQLAVTLLIALSLL